MRKFPYTDILGWSASRYETFRSCKRMYFYTYYNKFDKDFPREKIIRLRDLTTQAMEAGSVAHEVISTLLYRLQKDTRPIDRDKLDFFIEKMVNDISGKKEFFEVYYGKASSPDLESLRESARSSVYHLLDSDRYQWILEKAQHKKDEWIIEPEGFGETRIDGMKAYCKVDFMLPDENKVYIFDWKSGKPEIDKHRKQVIGYALFAHHNYGFDPKTIFPILAYLKDNYQEEVITIADNELSEFKQQVRTESEQMYAFNKDVNKNTPLEKDAFPMVSNPNFCAYCSFRELCGR